MSTTKASVAKRLAPYRTKLALVAALVGTVVVGAVLVPFRGTFANTAAALTMEVVIAAVAVAGNRAAGVVASVSGAVWFDFFLTKPYDRFEISHRFDLETAIAIFVVGFLITELAGRSRHHLRAANDSTQYVSMIHAVAVMAAESVPATQIIEQASSSLVILLSLRSCRFETSLSDPPLARIDANGEVMNVGLRWPAGEIGIPGPESEILARWRGRVMGRFVLTPTPGAPITYEQRIVAIALVDVVAAYVMDEHHAA